MAVSPTTLPIPAVDDRKLYELRATRHALPTLTVAKEMELFERLEKGPKTIEEIAEELQLTPRAAEAMTIVVTALGFLARYNDGQYGLTDLARTYLLPTSPFYYHELMQEDDPSVEQLRRVFRSDDQPIQPIAVKMRDLTDKQVENFINRMHTITLPAARGLADQEVFGSMDKLLDVGGGSGSLCLGIANRHPKIQCTIMDFERVCQISQRNIGKHKLVNSVTTVAADMFSDPWPSNYDGVLFGNIFHDWDWKSCQYLARQALKTLNPGGRICLHEMLLNEFKDGPLVVACYSVAMLLHERGKQYTAMELQTLLTETGFVDFQTRSTFGYYSLITAVKP